MKLLHLAHANAAPRPPNASDPAPVCDRSVRFCSATARSAAVEKRVLYQLNNFVPSILRVSSTLYRSTFLSLFRTLGSFSSPLEQFGHFCSLWQGRNRAHH